MGRILLRSLHNKLLCVSVNRLSMLIFLFFWLMVFALLLIAGAFMAPFAINKQKLKESGYSSSVHIMHLPELFMKSWYEPQKLYVRHMVVFGFLGSVIGFSALYILSELGVV
jgi:hypothetical protein